MTEDDIKQQLAEMVSEEATDPVIPEQSTKSEFEEEPEWQQLPNS